MNNTLGPIQSATGDVGSAPKKQRKAMTLQEKTDLLDMYHGDGCGPLSQDKWIQCKDSGFGFFFLKLHQYVWKPWGLWSIFLSGIENAAVVGKHD